MHYLSYLIFFVLHSIVFHEDLSVADVCQLNANFGACLLSTEIIELHVIIFSILNNSTVAP